jgi:hypothetical protein
LIAGKAAGLFNDLAQKADECARPSGQPLQPNPELRPVYDPQISKYMEMQKSLVGFFS